MAKLHKEDFQAVDIASIAKRVTKIAMTVLEFEELSSIAAHAPRASALLD